MRKRKLFILIVIITLSLFLFYKIFFFLKVDDCLDKGGSWNKEKCECEF